MADKKAAVQISIGFIITIVIAVVFLALILNWMRGMMGGMTGMTEDLRSKAATELDETFRTTAKVFDIYPHRTRGLLPGSVLFMSVGMKNTCGDGQAHSFSVSVNAAGTSVDAYTTSKMDDWVAAPPAAKMIANGGSGSFDITYSVPADVPDGIYIFNILACGSCPSVSGGTSGVAGCTGTTSFMWGTSAEQLTIEIKRA